VLGSFANQEGDYARAVPYLEESYATIRSLGKVEGLAMALADLGVATAHLGEPERGVAMVEEAVAATRDLGDRAGIPIAMIHLISVYRLTGNYDGARRCATERLALLQEMGLERAVGGCLLELAVIATESGQSERAARLLGAADAILSTPGFRMPARYQGNADQATENARAALGDAAFDAAHTAGRAMIPAEAAAWDAPFDSEALD
jgi:tetratricopeptide (TPR) repeat protein